MKRLKFALEFALTLALIAGLIWAVRERMELRAETLRLAEAAVPEFAQTSQTSTVLIYPDGASAGMPYSPEGTGVDSGDPREPDMAFVQNVPLETIRIGLAGDIDIPEILKSKAAEHADFDFLSGVAEVRDRLDILAANLESQFTASEAATSAKSEADIEEKKEFLLKDHPKWAAYLAKAGFNVLGVANNHSMDYGWAGLEESLAALNNAGVSPVGAGSDEKAARAPRFIKVKGKTIGFLAYSTIIPQGYAAESGRPGIAAGRGTDRSRLGDEYRERLSGEVKKARDRCDFLIVGYHWGSELAGQPDPFQREIAAALADAGADCIFGHGPHSLQPAEMLGGVPVAFSLGDFIWHNEKDTALFELVLTLNGEGGVELSEAVLHFCKINDGAPVLIGENRTIFGADGSANNENSTGD